MNQHDTWHQLSAYMDGRLSTAERATVEAHLSGCPSCHGEWVGLQSTALYVSRIPRRLAPDALLQRLKNDFSTRPLLRRNERIGGLFRLPVLAPVGALVVVGLLAGVWRARQQNTDTTVIHLEPLLAAHSRYQAENLIPDGDMAESNLSIQLASFYGHEHAS